MDSYMEESLDFDVKSNSLHIKKPVWKSPSLKMRRKTRRKQRKETIKIFRKCRLTKRIRKSLDEAENNDERSFYDETEVLRSEDCSETNRDSSDFMQTLYEEFIIAESLQSQRRESTFMHGKQMTVKFPEEISHISPLDGDFTIQNDAKSLHSQDTRRKESTFMHGKEMAAKFPEEISHISRLAEGCTVQNDAENLHSQDARRKESTFMHGKEMAVKFPEEISHISRLAEGSTIENDAESLHGQYAHLKESNFIPGKEITVQFLNFDYGNKDSFLDIHNITQPEKLEEGLFCEKIPEPTFIEKSSKTVGSTAKHGEKKSESSDVTENQPCIQSTSFHPCPGPDEKTLCETELHVCPFSGTIRKVPICSLSRINLKNHRFDAKITKKPLRDVSASVMKKIRSLPRCSISNLSMYKLKPIDEQEEELI